MKFLLDENFPKAACAILKSRGHQVIDIRETEVLLTTDRDFYHTVPYLYPQNHGIVVVALHQPNRENIIKKLSWFLDHFGNMPLDNKVFELRDTTYVTYSTT